MAMEWEETPEKLTLSWKCIRHAPLSLCKSDIRVQKEVAAESPDDTEEGGTASPNAMVLR
jgi:hypothetical protein